MAIFKSLFKSKEFSSAKAQASWNCFVNFVHISVRSWDDAEHFLTSHKELLGENEFMVIAATISGLAATVDQGKFKLAPGEKEKYLNRAKLLARCREVGISSAFKEIRINPGAFDVNLQPVPPS